MQQLDVTVSRRSDTGKGPNRRLRGSGKIPAVIYGISAPIKVALDAHSFERQVSSRAAENMIINMNFDGGDGGSDINTAIIREIQRDPVTRRVLHVDLYRIRMDVENDFEVAIHAVGSPIGVKEGGILETVRRIIEIRCLPTMLPSSISVNITDLKVNHSIHVSDLQVPEGVTILSDADEVLFTVVPPKQEVVATPTAEAATEETAEPEVIGKKKAEEEPEEEKK